MKLRSAVTGEPSERDKKTNRNIKKRKEEKNLATLRGHTDHVALGEGAVRKLGVVLVRHQCPL